MLCKVQIDTSVCREVHEACTKALENGMDETYRFSELLHPTLTTRSTATPNLGARINRYFAAPFIRSVQEASIDLKALAASKVQIYWPYSEDWDGKTLPLISFAPKDENQEWNIAYKFDDQGVIVDSIMVNEESMMQRPIWIINNSDRDRVLSTTKETRNTRTTSQPGKIYTVNLGRFMAEKQYDSAWAGGSEFVVKFAYLDDSKAKSLADSSKVQVREVYIPVYRSRKDIRKRRWTDVNTVMAPNWKPNYHEGFFMLIEEDQGSAKQEEMSLSITIFGKKLGFESKLPLKSRDEEIYKQCYPREFIFSTSNYANGTWVQHQCAGVYWTLPFQIGTALTF